MTREREIEDRHGAIGQTDPHASSLHDQAEAWERERIAIEEAGRALGSRRNRHQKAGDLLRERIAEEGGSVHVPGWVLTVSENGRGIQRTRTTPPRRPLGLGEP